MITTRIATIVAVTSIAVGSVLALSAPVSAQDSYAVATPTVTIAQPSVSPHAYAPAGVGSPTPQGNGNAPANGTVGKADDKNPPGQAPNGTDPNSGYECDKNQGVGNNGGNPAHSGCTSPTPTKSASPTPTPTATSTATATPSPIKSITPTQPATCATKPKKCAPPTTAPPSPKPSPSVSKSPKIIVCQVGPCVPPPNPCDVNPAKCLPVTGPTSDVLLPVGVFLFLGGAMILALLNLVTQIQKYRAIA